MIVEWGVASIPPSWFSSKANASEGEGLLRFALWQTQKVLDAAAERLTNHGGPRG
jgi:hypothetical protein